MTLPLAARYLSVDRPGDALAALDGISGDELLEPEYWRMRSRRPYCLERYEEGVEAARQGLQLAPERPSAPQRPRDLRAQSSRSRGRRPDAAARAVDRPRRHPVALEPRGRPREERRLPGCAGSGSPGGRAGARVDARTARPGAGRHGRPRPEGGGVRRPAPRARPGPSTRTCLEGQPRAPRQAVRQCCAARTRRPPGSIRRTRSSSARREEHPRRRTPRAGAGSSAVAVRPLALVLRLRLNRLWPSGSWGCRPSEAS